MDLLSAHCHNSEKLEGGKLIEGVATSLNLTSLTELAGLINEVTVEVEVMDSINKKLNPKSKLATENRTRQEAMRYFYEGVEALSCHPVAAKKEIGEKMLYVLDTYHCKQIYRASFAGTTTSIEGVIDIFQTEEYQNLLTEAGDLGLYFAEVVSANNEFRAKRNAYEKSKATKHSGFNLSEQGDKLSFIVNKKLIAFLNYKIIAEPDLYRAAYEMIDEIIKDINENVKRRRTLRENSELESDS